MLVLPSEITHNQARACALAVGQEIQTGSDLDVVLDATPLIKFDSSALAVMLQCRREVIALGRGFSVQGLAPGLQQLAGVYGVAELLALA